MTNNNIKNSIYQTLINQKLDDETDKIIVSCLMYDYISRVLKMSNGEQNDINSLASSYFKLFKNSFSEYKKNAVSYSIIRSTVEGFKKNSILEYYEDEIEEIAKYYQDKTQLVPFSSNYFSQYMYRIIKLSNSQYERLSNIHFNIMIPIINFYKVGYGAKDSDLEIFSAEGYAENPGKEIIFTIKDYESSRVINDIKVGKINFKSSIYSVSSYKNYIKIVVN
jgi:hypothetical protein